MRRTVEVTDRGVYETLGLAPLRPGRSPAYTAHAHDLDYVIAVDAGRRRSPKPTSALTPFRLARSFDAYWAMRDERLPVALDDLVRRETVVAYPTDFAAMSSRDRQDITTRGDLLTRVLLAHYLRDLC